MALRPALRSSLEPAERLQGGRRAHRERADGPDDGVLVGVASCRCRTAAAASRSLMRLGDGTVAGRSAEPTPHLRQVQRQVVEDRQDAVRLQVGDQRLPACEAGHQQVEHVVRLLAVRRDDGQPHVFVARPVRQRRVVALPESRGAVPEWPRWPRAARTGTPPGCRTAGSSSRRPPRCTCPPGRGRTGCGWCPSRG